MHLTGEQQLIRWLQCSRAGRDLQSFTIPHHAKGQAKSARVADSAHSERRRLDADVIGPGVVVLAVDAGVLDNLVSMAPSMAQVGKTQAESLI